MVLVEQTGLEEGESTLDTRFGLASASGLTVLPGDRHTPAVLIDTDDPEELFSKLYSRYEPPILLYTRRLLGNDEDARDSTQDAFLKAYRSLPETLANGGFQPQAWLYRIATNVCLDWLRHRNLKTMQGWETDYQADEPRLHPSQIARDNPEKEAMQTETRHEVGTVLDRLSPRYRAALVLREFHGLGYDQIANIMGISRVAVKALLLRARESFRLHYAKEYPELAAQARGPRVLPRSMGRVSNH